MSLVREKKNDIPSRDTLVVSLKGKLRIYLSALIFTTFTTYIPWDSIDSVKFVDLDSYAQRIIQLYISDSQTNIIGATYAAVFTSEPTWFFLLQEIVSQNIEPEFFLACTSIFSAFIFGVFSAIRIGPILGPLTLINPLIIDLLNSQVRSALAISFVFLVMLLFQKKRFHILAMVGAATIHSAMILVAVFYGLASKLADLSFNNEHKLFLPLMVGLGSALVFSLGIESTLLYLGDRRANTLDGGKSLFYLVPWLSFYALFFLGINAHHFQKHLYNFTVSLMGFVLVAEALGTSLFRLMPLCLPIFLTNLNYMQRDYKTLFVVLFCLNNILLFAYWFDV